MKASQRFGIAVLLALFVAISLAALTPPAAHAADLTVQTIAEAGITPSYAAGASGGDKFSNGAEDVFCHIKNLTTATSVTVTIPANANARTATGVGAVTKADAGAAVAGGADKMFGPFPRLAFNGSDGKVSINYSAMPLACQGGANAGVVCTVDSQCPSSTCASGIRVGCFKVPRTR